MAKLRTPAFILKIFFLNFICGFYLQKTITAAYVFIKPCGLHENVSEAHSVKASQWANRFMLLLSATEIPREARIPTAASTQIIR